MKIKDKVFNKYIFQKSIPVISILIMVYLMLQYQLANHVTLLTTDRWIHFYRFYEDAMQIKTGNFSYFQSNYAFFQSGRIFNALYGPLFAYLNGLLILLTGTWYRYATLTIFLVLLIGGLGMYKLLRKVKVNTIISLFLTLIYLEVGSMPGILRFNFMALGSMLAPYVMIEAVNMINDPKKPIHWLNLGIIMAIVAQVHLLSTVILTVTLIPFAVYGFIKTHAKKEMVIDLGKAIGIAAALTANIWGSFIVLYSKNKLALPNPYHMASKTFRLMKMNATYKNAWSNYGVVVLVAILMLAQVIFVIVKRKQSSISTFSTWVSVVFFVISSQLVPWAKIQVAFPRLSQNFQFPYRLLVGAWPLMIMSIGITLTYFFSLKEKPFKETIIVLLGLVTAQAVIPVVINNYKMTSYWATPTRKKIRTDNYKEVAHSRASIQKTMNTSYSGKLFKEIYHIEPDYLPIKKRANNTLYEKDIVKKSKKYHHRVEGSKLILTWKGKKNTHKILPLITYKQSQLVVNGKKLKKIHTNSINLPIVKSHKGKNTAVLSFKSPIWFWILLWITILSWCGVVMIKIMSYRKKKLDFN